MKIKKVLIVYKKSSYEEHALQEKDPNYLRLVRERSVAIGGSKKIHQEHLETFWQVQEDLASLGIPFVIRQRYYLKEVLGYNLILTIGGDGTFLEASHYVSDQLLMGINSAPSQSVGYYCRTYRKNFRQKMMAILRGKFRLQRLARLLVRLPRGERVPLVLNDILFTNCHPAGTTRYLLSIGRIEEEQKSSGIWIAPAPGSTAAIHSAGGRVLPVTSKKFQFVVREPYQPFGNRYRLLKRIVSPAQEIKILSMMDEAAIYVDGPHLMFPLRRGEKFTVCQSNQPLYAVW
ncbi:MAG: NAD(+)/NADH kinase [Deltaproteobacteria bacterium]|nr:NAD(+)/NADH kinase [Deltaproteobacteria bacterium]